MRFQEKILWSYKRGVPRGQQISRQLHQLLLDNNLLWALLTEAKFPLISLMAR